MSTQEKCHVEIMGERFLAVDMALKLLRIISALQLNTNVLAPHSFTFHLIIFKVASRCPTPVARMSDSFH